MKTPMTLLLRMVAAVAVLGAAETAVAQHEEFVPFEELAWQRRTNSDFRAVIPFGNEFVKVRDRLYKATKGLLGLAGDDETLVDVTFSVGKLRVSCDDYLATLAIGEQAQLFENRHRVQGRSLQELFHEGSVGVVSSFLFPAVEPSACWLLQFANAASLYSLDSPPGTSDIGQKLWYMADNFKPKS